MPDANPYETQFYTALRDIFVGAKVEGDSGYVNLMRVKSRYYTAGVFPQLQKDIHAALNDFPHFREELFDKLGTFFQRYFSESGSIYFRYTSLHHNIYEKVYTDDRDVVLFWKTHMLYYVKTDRVFTSLEVEVDDLRFFFDATEMTLKKSNEKRETVYAFREIRPDGVLVFSVAYSERGRVTKTDDILKTLKTSGRLIPEETLLRAFRVFEKQTEVDFFINKDARSFLREQFDLWMYQYLFDGKNTWDLERIRQLQTLKEIAYKIIDFIAQFEDELVRIWNKPKFVRNSHYIITLDRLLPPSSPLPSPIGEGPGERSLLPKILAHPNFPAQLEEWRGLGMLPAGFDSEMLTARDLSGALLYPQYQYLPLDTCYFPDLELEILALFANLDAALDGWLIHSENYQALNALMQKFRDRVQTIYIDPPFNKQKNGDYLYLVKYKDSSWISILENRIKLAIDLMNRSSSIYVKCDYNGNMYVRMLLNDIFGEDNFRSELIWKRRTSTQIQYQSFAIMNDTIYCFSKTDDWNYYQQFEEYSDEYIETQFRYKDEKGEPYLIRNFYAAGSGPSRIFNGKEIPPPKGHHWRYSQENIDKLISQGKIILDSNGYPKLKQYLSEMRGKPYDNLLTNIHVVQGSAKEFTEFPTQNPEKLLKLFVLSSSNPGDIVMDFYLGSGTTIATAHKLGRKWIGIEMGEHFHDIVIPRMKKVLFGDDVGITKESGWKGGGFFKYYSLEQYEDVLRRARYADADLFSNPYQDPYSSYVFLKDLKYLESLEIDAPADAVHIHPELLYPDIDLAETLSCIRGKWIKRITAETVEFQDGETLSLTDPDWRILKPLIWW